MAGITETGLSISNPSPQRLPGPALLHHLIKYNVSDHVPAVEFCNAGGERERLTYSELHHKANVLARRILTARTRHEQAFIVPIFLPQCPALYISQLAVLKAGGAFCPLVLDIPEERLRFILEDINAECLVTTKGLLSQLPQLSELQLIAIDDVGDCNCSNYDAPMSEVHTSSPAYVMYTSGSTGQPKGVILSHSAATQALLAHDRHIPSFSRFLQFASPTFDVSIFEIFFPLFKGCTLVACDRRLLLNDLPKMINDLEVDAAELTPSVANSLLRTRAVVPNLKILLTIGEMLKQPVINEFAGSNDTTTILWGMYGPTEATIHCTLQPHFMQDMSVRNIGTPLDTVSAFIVRPPSDDDVESDFIRILPVGEEGELVVGGFQLADGYLNRPEQTKAAFVSHPEYGMLYRTGDRARMFEDGHFECLGRISSGQIKLRGQRIELGEIEFATSRTPNARSVVAEVIDGTLVTFVEVDEPSPSEAAVRETCRKWLPAFMVPSDILTTKALPYLASGKVDRKGLRDEYLRQRRLPQQMQGTSRSEKYKELVCIISEVLNTSVDESTNLSAAGLDSLTSIQLASLLRRRGYPKMDANDLLEAGDVEGIERIFQTATTIQGAFSSTYPELRNLALRNSSVSESNDTLLDVFPSTSVQAAMLTETARSPGAYCNWIEFSLSSAHQETNIISAIREVADSHQMLRAGFINVSGKQTSFVNIIWKELSDEQIRIVHDVQRNYVISVAQDLLRASSFQIKREDNCFRVVLRIHHAAYDQWSIDIFRNDLQTVLEGSSIQTRPSFAAVASFEKANLEHSIDSNSPFWSQYLSQHTTTLLPRMIPKLQQPNLVRLQNHALGITAEVLRSKARQLGCSPPSVLQTALAYLLGLYTATNDVLFGTVFSGRTAAVDGIEETFGPCMTTLPFRLDLSASKTWSSLAFAAHDSNRSISKHAFMPLAEIKKLAGTEASALLFDTLFVWQETTRSSVPLQMIKEVASADNYEFSLVIEAEPADDNIYLHATYQASLLPEDQVAALLEQLQIIVNHILENPESEILDSPLLHHTNTMAIYNPTPSHLYETTDLLATIDSQASESAPAISFGNSLAFDNVEMDTLTYSDLILHSNNMAHILLSRDPKKNSPVCICMEKSFNLYIAILGTIKAGLAYMPLLPDTPRSRIKAIFGQAQPQFILCDANSREAFEQTRDASMIDLDIIDLSSGPSDSPGVKWSSDTTAYIIFTSGSTGEPKGVPVTYGNLVSNLVALKQIYPANRSHRLLQACSQAFDVSVFEIFFTFYRGMCLCTARKDDLFQDLEFAIRSLGVTHLSMTPTVAALIDPVNVPSVQFLVTAGEALTATVHQNWAGQGLFQGYGPSETTNICTINPNVQADDHLSNIGKSFNNTSTFVIAVNEPFKVLPFGAYGEFVFGGEQVFDGYLGRDDLNTQKIIRHSIYGKLYRSGDCGRMLPDGTLIIQGRLDDQVKVHGNRIELGEIHSQLLLNSLVSDCVVLVTSEGSSRKIVGFWLPKEIESSNQEPDLVAHANLKVVPGLFDQLEDALPSYMVPSTLLPVRRIPLTTQGKVDKRKLAQVFLKSSSDIKTKASRLSDDVDDSSEWSANERSLARVVRTCLGCVSSQVQRNTSLYALGLDSLKAISLARAIREEMGRSIKISTLLRSPTIRRITRALQEQDASSPSTDVSQLSACFDAGFVVALKAKYEAQGMIVEKVLPCTPLQEAMISAANLTSGHAYCNELVFRVEGDISKLHKCWSRMIERHEILRTVFVETDSREFPFAQAVMCGTNLLWHEISPVVDGVSPTANTDSKRVNTQINLDTPLRISISRSGCATQMIVRMHHAIYDGMSMNLLLQEIQDAYYDGFLPQAPSFEPFLSEMIRQNNEDTQSFWKSSLSGLKPKLMKAPLDSRDLQMQETNFTSKFSIQPERLEAFCRRHSVSTLAVFQSAWAKSLSTVTNAADVCFGNVVSGRSVSVSGVERLIAPCFNTIAVRVNLGIYRTNRTLTEGLHSNNIEAQDFQLAALRRIQAWAGLGSRTLFDSLLLLQPPSANLDEKIWVQERDAGLMDVPIVVEVCQSIAAYELHLHVSPSSGLQPYESQVADLFKKAVEEIISFPSERLESFPQKLSAMHGLFSASDNVADGELDSNGGSITEQLPDSLEARAVTTTLSALSGVDCSHIRPQGTIYQLGLDSLNAIQLATQLRKQGYAITAADVLENPSAATLVQFLKYKKEAAGNESEGFDFDAFEHIFASDVYASTGISSAQIETLRPCTAIQSGMLAQSLDSQGGLYINHISYQMPAEVTLASLKAALQRITEKHQILRTGFAKVENAKTPFAMLIYKEPTLFINIGEKHTAESQSGSESKAQDSIVKHLEQPAWRVTFSDFHDSLSIMLSIHHALYDADSLRIILSDLARTLQGEDIGPATSLDGVLSMLLQTAEDKNGESSGFWSRTLNSASPTKFPDLTPTTQQKIGLQVAELQCGFSSSDLDKLCTRCACTIQALGQTTWASILSAYVGELNVTFGTVLSTRASADTRSVAFPSISTIPIPCNAGKPFEEVLSDMMELNARVQRHKLMPLADLQRLAGLPEQRLFDSVFVYQKSFSKDRSFDWPVLKEAAAVDYAASLELETSPTDDTVTIRLTFDSKLIPYEHGIVILHQYQDLILQNLEGRSYNVDLLSIVPAHEESIAGDVHYLHEFVEVAAKRNPEKVAMQFVDAFSSQGQPQYRTWSYRALNKLGNQVANLVQSHGVGAGGIIAVCMPKCPEASFAFLGILKAGCAFLALDPELPSARKKFILRDSKSKVILVDSAFEDDPEISEVAAVVSVEEKELKVRPETLVAISSISENTTSYCLYTSGTTGTPKGCEISHRNAVQAMLAFQRLFAGHWTKSSRWLQFASYWFDVSVLEQFWSWSVEICVVGAPRDLVLEDLPFFIRALNITQIDLTPSLARLVQPEDVPSLHGGVFITGGEALKQEIIEAWGSYKTICNGYGPTEATIGVTMNPFIGPADKPSNIGRAFDNVGAYVLKPGTGEPVPRGAVGELCVSGPLVGTGYLNRPELTANAFPYLRSVNARVYRTGDLVRLLWDDTFSFLGRKDTQAKLRGQRLEIGEIDAVLLASSDKIVDVASIVSKSSRDGKEMLVSFLSISTERKGVAVEALQPGEFSDLVRLGDQACRSHLPGYMVPTHIIPINFVPLTVNNKVDNKRLKQVLDSLPLQHLQALKHSSGERREFNVDENRLAEALAEYLSISVSELTPGTRMLSAGLSSISAISFVSILKKRGYEAANVATIVRNPSISELHMTLSGSKNHSLGDVNALMQAKLQIRAFEQRWLGQCATRLGVAVQNIESVVPCTPLQQGLILDSTRQESRPYFNVFNLRLRNLDAAKLREAWQAAADNIEVLRVRFLGTDDGHAMVTMRQVSLDVIEKHSTHHPLDAWLQTERDDWLKINDSDIVQPLRLAFVYGSNGDVERMHVFIHHALYDGISWELLMDRVAATYGGQNNIAYGPSFVNALPYGPLQVHSAAKDFWASSLQGTQFDPIPITGYEIREDPVTVGAGIAPSNSLDNLVKKLGISHQALAQACFAIALHQYAPNTSVIGMITSGRFGAIDMADSIIGPLFNTLPLPMMINKSDTWLAITQKYTKFNVDTLPYQHTPLRSIRKFCGRHPSDPMFDALFVFQQHVEETPPSDELWTEDCSELSPEYSLAFEVELTAQKTFSVRTVAKAGIIHNTALGTLLRNFETALTCCADAPESLISKSFAIQNLTASTTQVGSLHEIETNPDIHDFEWTENARAIRTAIVGISGLHESQIDKHSTIYGLGLDSIDTVKLASRLRKVGLSMPVSKILQAQSIPRMIEYLDANKQPANGVITESAPSLELGIKDVTDSREDFDANKIERIVPATPSQEAILAKMFQSNLQHYYNHDVLRLRKGTDLGKLRAAWQAVMDATPILRTTFAEVASADLDATYAQLIHRPLPLDVLTIKDPQDQEQLERTVESLRPQDFSNQDQLPFQLATSSINGAQYLVLSLAHAQYDGHSLALLHEDVQRAYYGKLAQRPSYDFAIRQALHADGDAAYKFWKGVLSGAAPCHFPAQSNKGDNAVTHRVESVSKTNASSVKQFCQQHGISMQTLAQTCWASVLSLHTKSLDVIFGAVLACRDDETAEQTIFPMMNTVVMRAALYGSKVEFARHIQNISIDALQFQRTPLRTIQAAGLDVMQVKPKNGEQGLFNTLFIYQHRPEADEEQIEQLYDSIGGRSSVEYPVAVEMEVESESIIFRMACENSILDESAAGMILSRIDHVLTSIMQDPSAQVVEFKDSQASVCGLPHFTLSATGIVEVVDQSTRLLNGVPTSNRELPKATQPIRETLARVAKIDVDELKIGTTIESIGIDSISAIKVVSALKQQGLKLSVSDILKAKTAENMAELLECNNRPQVRPISQDPNRVMSAFIEQHRLADTVSRIGLNLHEIEQILPASAGQLYMISMWQKTEGQLFYPTFEYHVHGEVTGEQVEKAFRILKSRHPILRTHFVATSSAEVPLLQVVTKVSSSKKASGNSTTTILQAPSAIEVRRSSNAKKGHLVRLKIHHALYDAVSLQLLIEDLASCLRTNSSSIVLPSQSELLALSITDTAKQSQEHFWCKHLAGLNPLTLAQPPSSGAQTRVDIFKPQTSSKVGKLSKLCQQKNITLQSILFAAWAKVYVRLAVSNQQKADDTAHDVVLGIYLSNRSHLENVEKLTAPTINLVPLAVRSAAAAPLLDLARIIHQDLQNIGAVGNCSTSLFDISRWTGFAIDTFVNFLRFPDSDQADGQVDDGIHIASLEEHRLENRGKVVHPEISEDQRPSNLLPESVLDAYQHSVDLELGISNGCLDVGLFSPESMLELRAGEEAIAEFKRVLEDALVV
ncbi:putative Non-ribosomal peptide synthetase [Polychaeton citri CBS 116435]|uniref:Non-ribosomal peptide synthetase n=1 Tax=Polychaeton citri CBS 116435 TaxID=1314669 RepID=A0A9P4Q2T3_9PEZI|nr:putative Non-ribosomal peptide synthetase [Polychaeton citri CBS 116435]